MSKPTSVPELKAPEVKDLVDERPIKGPAGTRMPYPVDAPGYLPGTPLEPPGRM